MVRNYALTKTDTHLHSLMVTMSQKSSDPQAVKSVSQVLIPDNILRAGGLMNQVDRCNAFYPRSRG